MSNRLKAKKTSNKKFLKGKKFLFFLLLGIFVFSLILTVALIISLHLPERNLAKYYNFTKVFVNGTHNNWGILTTSYVAFVCAFGMLLFKNKGTKMIFLRIILLIIFTVGIFSPICVTGFGVEIVEVYSKQFEEMKSQNDRNASDAGSTEEKDQEDTQEVQEIKPIFIVNFKDTLFSLYEYTDLKANENILKEEIINQICAEIDDFNKNSDKDYFNSKTAEVYDYEFTYKFYYNNNLFENHNRDERINKLNESIQIRKEANDKFFDSTNQRLIATRYIDLGDELRKMGNDSQAIENYKQAIYWSLTALQTMHNENPKSDKNQIYSIIVKSYRYISEIYDTSQEDNYNRAILLMQLYGSFIEGVNTK